MAWCNNGFKGSFGPKADWLKLMWSIGRAQTSYRATGSNDQLKNQPRAWEETLLFLVLSQLLLYR